MNSSHAIVAALNSLKPGSDWEQRQNEIADLIEASEESQEIVQNVLQLFERYPEADFGSPGPLAHSIERFYGRGYEDQLLASLGRTPTPLTLWLANRIINAGDHNRRRFLTILGSIGDRTDLLPLTAEEARRFLRLQNAG